MIITRSASANGKEKTKLCWNEVEIMPDAFASRPVNQRKKLQQIAGLLSHNRWFLIVSLKFPVNLETVESDLT